MTVPASAVEAAARLEQLLETQRQAQLAGGAVSRAVREDRLDRCTALLAHYRDPICEALDADFEGRHRAHSLMNDLLGSLTSVKHCRNEVKRWIKPERRKSMVPFSLFGAKAWIEHQPKGVVGIMGTWNFPVFTLFSPLAYVLAGGNRAILKPSELTPRTAELMAEAFARYFDESEVAVINGGADVGAAFSAAPFDHLLMTGGTQIGKAVMRAASEHLVPVTLELGGKSPVLVSRSADLRQTAERIINAKTINSGQVCVSPDLCFVPSERLEEFLGACQATFAARYPTIKHNKDVTAIVNERHFQRVNAYVQDARARGARVVACNPANEDFSTLENRRMPLYLVVQPPGDALIMQHEIFGHAMVVLTYDSIDQAIDYINAHDRPLALYYFGRDRQEERQVLDRTISGGVTINDIALHPGVDDAPFGGIGPSGMGRYHGPEGFKEFTHPKTVFRQGWYDPRGLIGLLPPYKDRLTKMLEAQVK